MDLRLKIEKEFDENPLLRNLGVTIYGSVYESRQQAQQAAATGTAANGVEITGRGAATSHHATKTHHKTVVCQFSVVVHPSDDLIFFTYRALWMLVATRQQGSLVELMPLLVTLKEGW